MKSTKNLRLRLRLMEGALLLLLAVGTTAAVSTHQLLLDAANHPTSDFDLAGTHVVGTLDNARLSARVPLLDPYATTLTGYPIDTQGGAVSAGIFNFNSDGGSELISWSNPGIRFVNDIDGLSELSTDGSGNVSIAGSMTSSGLFWDAGGNLQAATITAYAGLGLWGQTPPASQPATPASQAEIIAVLQAYGLCQ